MITYASACHGRRRAVHGRAAHGRAAHRRGLSSSLAETAEHTTSDRGSCGNMDTYQEEAKDFHCCVIVSLT